MHAYATQVISGGGEGVMIRKPLSMYENGRSHSVLKYKVFISHGCKDSRILSTST